MGISVEVRAALTAKLAEILPHLDERQRRLMLGAEARSLGHGGIKIVAEAAGVAVGTVARGARQLRAGVRPLGRARGIGGGRKTAVKIMPNLRKALLALVKPDMRGDPMSPLRWTTKSTRTLAAELTRQCLAVSAPTVGRILRAECFSLQGNAKTLEGTQHADRDAQFRHINQMVGQFLASGDPVVSIDSKKKERIGPYARRGRVWRPRGQPVRVRDHDFPDEALGTVIPYGIYDLATNTGWVNVGVDHNTAQFAVASLRRWWRARGHLDHPNARRLLVTADAGSSNDHRSHYFKRALADLALEIGVPISVCHFPPGTSKWNAIEHQLFSHISMNWRGQPLESHEVVLNTIRATTTSSGLRVEAELDPGAYPTGLSVPDDQFRALPIDRDPWHPEWNYTIRPEPVIPVPPAPRPAGTPGPGGRTTPRPSHDHRVVTHQILAHPALTGLSPHQFTHLLDTYVPMHLEQRQRRLERGRDRNRNRHPDRDTTTALQPGGRTPRHSLADWVLATVLRYRFGLGYPVLRDLFGATRATINTWVHTTRTFFLNTSYPLTEPMVKLSSLADLIEYARAAGIDITPAIPDQT